MQYRRMFQFYAAGIPKATDPFEVAQVIQHAIETDQPELRYPVSWGGPEIIDGLTRLSDRDWVAMGALSDDAEYTQRFHEVFGLDISG
jgi:hypothetical protein